MVTRHLFRALVVLGTASVFVTSTLALYHWRGAFPPCYGGSGCETVLSSRLSAPLGVPLPYLGVVKDIFQLFCACYLLFCEGARRITAFNLSYIISGISTLTSTFLAIYSVLGLHALCTWCLASCVLSALYFVVCSLLASRRVEDFAALQTFDAVLFIGLFVGLAGGSLAVPFIEEPASGYRPALPYNANRVAALKPETFLADKKHLRGNPLAHVVVVEFSDFECPACRHDYPLVKSLIDENGIAWSFRHFPLPMHNEALPAAIASETAAANGKFWEAADMLETASSQDLQVTAQRILNAQIHRELTPVAIEHSKSLAQERVSQDLNLAQKLGLGATPTFIVLAPHVSPRVVPFEDLLITLQRPEYQSRIQTAK